MLYAKIIRGYYMIKNFIFFFVVMEFYGPD